jgi:hypothetical protein
VRRDTRYEIVPNNPIAAALLQERQRWKTKMKAFAIREAHFLLLRLLSVSVDSRSYWTGSRDHSLSDPGIGI